MSSSARPFNRLKRSKEPRSSHSGSRADVKRTKLNTGSAAPGLALTVPEDASKVAEEAELLRLMEEWKKEQADISYRAVRQNQLVRIWKDLYTNFKLIPDEGLLRIQGPVDERMYYPSYKELFEAMFPKHLGFVVNLEISPTGTVAGHHAQVDIGGFYTARIGKTPLAFVKVKAAAAAIFADGRYVADSQVRARLRDIVEQLRRDFPTNCPDRVYAVSALGLRVRFYYADVPGDVPDPIIIHPPPGPDVVASNQDPYDHDHWHLTILDSLSASTLKRIRNDAHEFAERVRSADVPAPDQEKQRASKRWQEGRQWHLDEMRKIQEDLVEARPIPMRDRLNPATSRLSSPITSAGLGEELRERQGAVPGQEHAVAAQDDVLTQHAPDGTGEDEVFFGKNLSSREFSLLGVPVPMGFIVGHLDVFKLLRDETDDDG